MKRNTNWAWLALLVAACFEVGWVVGLKYASTVMEWAATVIAILISFVLLISSGKRLAVGTAYAVFVGLGTAGTAAADILIFNEPVNVLTLLFIMTLLVGVIGLKSSTEEKTEEKGMK